MGSEPFTGGSNPDTGGRAMPPYEGRRETADVGDQSESVKEGAKVAGATGPVRDDEPKGADPADTARGHMRHPPTSSLRKTWTRTRPATRVSARTTSRVSSGART